MKITVLDGYTITGGDLSWQSLDRLGDVSVYDRTAPETIAERVEDADIVVSSKILWNEEAFDAASHLRFIALASTGYNVVDLDQARTHEVVVSNVPAYSTPDVAQMTFALMLELCFHVGDHSRGVHEGKWVESVDFSYRDYPLVELSGKTLGIIGMGSIGQAVAHIAAAFGMTVVFHNRSPKPELESKQCTQASMEEVIRSADFLSLHAPETPETKGLIDARTIDMMKDGAYLINTARGSLINEHDVAEALKNGKLAGAGVDVLSAEPMRADNPLLAAPHIIITPHIAWATKEARVRLIDTIVANVKAFIDGTPQNVVS